MERKLSSLWAKKNRNASGMCEWLPLSVHLNDTMAICRLIWDHWLSDGVKEFMINSIKTNGEVSMTKRNPQEVCANFWALYTILERQRHIFS